MIFKWLKGRRINELTAVGAVISADALVRGDVPRPRRLVRTQLGYGVEIWADYGEITRFTRPPPMVRDAKLVTGVDDAAALAKSLQVPLVSAGVRFSMPPPAILERACRESADRAVLLYADSCPRCRWTARAIMWLSAGRISGVPLSVPEWRRFYAEELPESRGSPVLVRNAKPCWGLRVFPLTLYVAVRGAFAAIGGRPL